MPSLKDIMELRKNERLYCDFMIRVVSSVVGKHNWNHRVNTKVKKLDELATATDEACALLLLENSYDRWVDISGLQRVRKSLEVVIRCGMAVGRLRRGVSPEGLSAPNDAAGGWRLSSGAERGGL